ncbi:MAG: Uncharacterized protein CEN90_606 [Parcubacteria group bacterium Licking1014_17]|nr:MAG: Uncharacterized protein CEN90_606 [Parcubacteria group bacterium Licking1014_17]
MDFKFVLLYMKIIGYFVVLLLVLGAVLAVAWFVVAQNTPANKIGLPSPTPTQTEMITPIPTSTSTIITPTSTPTISASTDLVELPVPYINEAPSNNWTGPWKNACEEASITMVEKFYQGEKAVSASEAESFMTMLFGKENALYGNNVNSDAAQFKNLIDNHTTYKATIVTNPTIDQIKQQIDHGHPVISLHYGFELNNPNIPFLRTGSSYHTMVIIGYDDSKQQFIVNDDGDTKAGAEHRYDYDLFMSTLHDFNYADGKADGLPTVIFTSPNL